MDVLTIVALCVQVAFICAMIYSARRRAAVETGAVALPRAKQTPDELSRLAAMRDKKLNEPLSEKTRPCTFSDIVGQEEGVRALMAALCGPNPQHVLIYGPPGVGKTCAARLVLEEAKRRPDSPFTADAQFVEMDATCIRFDERAIADPLIGSVHDPIYQGAGVLGGRGVPQPKPGAVTRAHCGMLFLDEIGELHPMQMNKLLKVLEDRRVRFESAYYAPENTGIPPYIHDIFQNGLPADFRLVGATTRQPDELPPALRSRCVELFFKPLTQKDLTRIAAGAALRAGMGVAGEAASQCARYSHSGRDAVNIIQLAAGLAHNDGREEILPDDIRWIARTCHYAPHAAMRLEAVPRTGVSAMLAVTGAGEGAVMELECTVGKSRRPGLTVNGIVESEELDARGRKLHKKSTARGSVENVLFAVSALASVDLSRYDVRFNIPGGLPADGPSAGVALAVALYSALTRVPPRPLLAATGEVTIHGCVRPVGGVPEKLAAAIEAGASRILIPVDNDEPSLHGGAAEVIAVSTLAEALSCSFDEKVSDSSTIVTPLPDCTFS